MRPPVTGFFDEATNTISYPHSEHCKTQPKPDTINRRAEMASRSQWTDSHEAHEQGGLAQSRWCSR
jgi:hypothetical protein